jgi:hypothetical protein
MGIPFQVVGRRTALQSPESIDRTEASNSETAAIRFVGSAIGARAARARPQKSKAHLTSCTSTVVFAALPPIRKINLFIAATTKTDQTIDFLSK